MMNDARLGVGKPTMGFLNPFLYRQQVSVFEGLTWSILRFLISNVYCSVYSAMFPPFFSPNSVWFMNWVYCLNAVYLRLIFWTL